MRPPSAGFPPRRQGREALGRVSSGAVKIVVDWDLCQGHGTCVTEAPGIFRLDADGNLVVVDENPPEGRRREVEGAVRHCPSYALRLEDDAPAGG